MGSSKKEKQQNRHAAFKSRIEKRHATTSAKKRRRPSKKLVADLQSLADALPYAECRGEAVTRFNETKISIKSILGKPGSLRRTTQLAKIEKGRFDQNMAYMATLRDTESREARSGQDMDPMGIAPTTHRWTALRDFISANTDLKTEAHGKGHAFGQCTKK